MRLKPLTLLAVAAAVPLSLAVAACGGNGDDNGTSTTQTPPKTASGRAATVGVNDNGSLGNILVDTQGRTLYVFARDVHDRSACNGACAAGWPPLKAGSKPVVGGGAQMSLAGTTKRSDGTAQVTYNGHPLYRFAGDAKPGDTNGQGITAFGGAWFTLSPAGARITAAPAGGSSGIY